MPDPMWKDEAALSMRFAELYSRCQDDFQEILISARSSKELDAEFADRSAQLFEDLFRLRSIGARLRERRLNESEEQSSR